MKISNETYLHFSEMSIYFKYKLHRGNFRVYRQLFLGKRRNGHVGTNFNRKTTYRTTAYETT